MRRYRDPLNTTPEGDGLSRSQIKSMVHGPYRPLAEDGRELRLTQLGYKIAAIHDPQKWDGSPIRKDGCQVRRRTRGMARR